MVLPNTQCPAWVPSRETWTLPQSLLTLKTRAQPLFAQTGGPSTALCRSQKEVRSFTASPGHLPQEVQRDTSPDPSVTQSPGSGPS